MKAKTKYRIGAVLSAAAISTMGLGLAGATTAGAAPGDSTAGATGASPDVTPAAAIPGTYEIFFNYGSGFADYGQLYLNSDNSWSLSEFVDGGTWETVGATLGMSDYNAGYPSDAAWAAKVAGTNLGSAAKPGEELGANVGSLSFYAKFISAASSPHHAQSGGPTLTAAVRPLGGQATFPGTYNTTIGGAGGYQTVYNSDNTWSMPGYCNSGTYLSFKVKKGTKITFTDIQADQGCANDHLWMAKEHGSTKIGTATKPGIIAEASLGGVYNHFYAVLAP